MIRNEGTLSLLGRLSKYALSVRRFSVTYLDSPTRHIFSEEEVLLMIQAADQFVKNDR